MNQLAGRISALLHPSSSSSPASSPSPTATTDAGGNQQRRSRALFSSSSSSSAARRNSLGASSSSSAYEDQPHTPMSHRGSAHSSCASSHHHDDDAAQDGAAISHHTAHKLDLLVINAQARGDLIQRLLAEDLVQAVLGVRFLVYYVDYELACSSHSKERALLMGNKLVELFVRRESELHLAVLLLPQTSRLRGVKDLPKVHALVADDLLRLPIVQQRLDDYVLL